MINQELEWQTRKERIDKKLSSLNPSWKIIHHSKVKDYSLLTNHAVEEYPTVHGPADYALFVEGKLLGILEAKKVLVNEFGGTLFTIAKDVKIQIEFNPAIVESYRLIGYENRLLNKEDFDNDKKDAGELGSGHTVSALYEIKLANSESLKKNSLKYQNTDINKLAKEGTEVATVKFRYKKPDGNTSILLEKVIPFAENNYNEMSNNFKFSAAVASFGMILRNSEFKGNSNYQLAIDLAKGSKGEDPEGYRSEFIQLVKLAEHL